MHIIIHQIFVTMKQNADYVYKKITLTFLGFIINTLSQTFTSHVV